MGKIKAVDILAEQETEKVAMAAEQIVLKTGAMDLVINLILPLLD